MTPTCSACGAPRFTKCRYCRPCANAYDYAWRRRKDRRCGTCHVPLPEGRHSTRCQPCQRRAQDRYLNRPNRRCTSCGDPVKRGHRSAWCPSCTSIYNVERHLPLARKGKQ